MRLEIASYKAIKYACLNFHYAKRLPATIAVAYSVFNNKNEWCGVVIYNNGARDMGTPYGLKIGQCSELIRVALNGKQELTSKVLSLSLKLFKKQNPLCKLIVSYADSDENHIGTIYQATNWFFVSSKKTSDKYIDKNGKEIHPRSHSATGYKKRFNNEYKKCIKTSDLTKIKKGLKHKYIYPLSKDMIPLCKKLSKPYPKKNNTSDTSVMVAQQTSNLQEGFDSTVSLNNEN